MPGRVVTRPITKLTAKLVPPNLFTTDVYPNLGPGVEGKPIPYGLGRASFKPALIDMTVGVGKYQWGDPTLMTTKQVHGVVAIKNTDDGHTRSAVTDYTVDLTQNTVVVNSGFPHKDYEIEIDVTGKPDGGGAAINTFGPVVKQLLMDLIGVPAAQIDISGTAGETKELGVWLGADGEQRPLDAILNSSVATQASIARSVNGRIQMNNDGSWLVRAFNPNFDPATGISLQRSELVFCDAVPDDASIYWRVVVYYNRNFSTENYPYQQATSVRTLYAFESAEVLNVYSYLRLSTDAIAVAAQTLAVAGGPRTIYDLEERTNKLFTARSGDVCLLTTTPAMHPTNAFSGEPFWLERVTKSLTPEPRVTARIRRVLTGVLVDPTAIIPILHWTGPTSGSQDMRLNPTLPFRTPGTYTLTVDANMTLRFRGVAGGAGGGSGQSSSGSGGGGGAINTVGDYVVLQQGSVYTLMVGALGTGGAGLHNDGGDGGDTGISVQGGTKYVWLEGGRHGRWDSADTNKGGRAIAGSHSIAGGDGGSTFGPVGPGFQGKPLAPSGIPGGGGRGGGQGDDQALIDSEAGSKGGNGGDAGEAGEPGDPYAGTGVDTFGWCGGRGGNGKGVAVPGLPAAAGEPTEFGFGGGGGGENHSAANDGRARIAGLSGQKGVALFLFVSTP